MAFGRLFDTFGVNMNEVYLLLGVNLGDRLRQLRLAQEAIAKTIGTLTRQSAIYRTSAWGADEKQPDYLNQVIRVETTLDPESVLKQANRIEAALGRTRDKKWESRLIDIDILFFANFIVNLPHLQIPHPHFQNRNFALIPMCEIAPSFVHPVLHSTMTELLEQSPDSLPVRVWEQDTDPAYQRKT